ncbi:MAG: RHS repeat-associated core domain-containing protein [Terrisporobacter sp.]
MKYADSSNLDKVMEPYSYTYDKNGNQTKEKDSITNVTVENTYDVDNRLSTSITVNGTKEVVNQENLYNGNGKRIQKKEGNNVVNYFYQDGVVSYTADKDGNKTSQNFIGADGNVIGTTRYSNEGFKYYTYNKDIQGSTTSVVGQDGTSPVAYNYDDFGVTTTIGDKSFFNEVCYTGGIYDVSTGLYYLNARYYDPKNGRFITRDTYRGELNEPDTLHLYAYCANNPINYVDPSGHMRIRKDIAVVGINLAYYAVSGFATAYFSNRAKKYFVKKLLANKARMKRHMTKYFRKYVSSSVANFALKCLDYIWIVTGSSIGQLIVNAIDTYIDPRLGYKKNNRNYIFG